MKLKLQAQLSGREITYNLSKKLMTIIRGHTRNGDWFHILAQSDGSVHIFFAGTLTITDAPPEVIDVK